MGEGAEYVIVTGCDIIVARSIMELPYMTFAYEGVGIRLGRGVRITQTNMGWGQKNSTFLLTSYVEAP